MDARVYEAKAQMEAMIAAALSQPYGRQLSANEIRAARLSALDAGEAYLKTMGIAVERYEGADEFALRVALPHPTWIIVKPEPSEEVAA